MKNNQGLASALALFAGVAVLAGGVWYWSAHQSGGSIAGGEQAATVSYSMNSNTGTSTPALAITADASTPSGGQLVMGSTGDQLVAFKLTDTANQNIAVSGINVFENQNAAGDKANFSNLQMWMGATLLGTASAPKLSVQTSTPGPGYIYVFHFASPIIVPAENSIVVMVRGDLAPYSSGTATDRSLNSFRIATSVDSGNTTSQLAVVAFGTTSNQQAVITLHAPNGRQQEVLRSDMTITATAIGGSNHIKSSVDNLGAITMTANPAGPIALTKIMVTFSGNIPSSTFLTGVSLIDQNGLSVTVDGATAKASAPCTGSNTCSVTWSFSGSGFALSGGTSYTFMLRINSSLIPPIGSNVVENLEANIQTLTSVAYKDGLDSAAMLVNLPPNAVPITINAVTYPVGQ